MKWWRKLTVDWPCALGDWLWENLVVASAAFLDRLTLRGFVRIIMQIVILVVLLAYFQQVVSLDLSFLFYVDANVYLDIAAAAFVLVARGPLLQILKMTTRIIWKFIHNRSKMLLRFGTRQSHNANALRRKDNADSPKHSDDDPAGIWDGPRSAFA